mmetsp:Transcript_25816/g.52506  ORF Transcript_25816/g.52506 Transcript_25816/m.52506 type:complete len:218 (+) Transcript_25816:132-785(+)
MKDREIQRTAVSLFGNGLLQQISKRSIVILAHVLNLLMVKIDRHVKLLEEGLDVIIQVLLRRSHQASGGFHIGVWLGKGAEARSSHVSLDGGTGEGTFPVHVCGGEAGDEALAAVVFVFGVGDDGGVRMREFRSESRWLLHILADVCIRLIKIISGRWFHFIKGDRGEGIFELGGGRCQDGGVEVVEGASLEEDEVVFILLGKSRRCGGRLDTEHSG